MGASNRGDGGGVCERRLRPRVLVVTAVTATPAPSGFLHRTGTLLAVLLATLATVMSSTMGNVVIPDVMGTFGIGQDQAHWIYTGFLSAMAAGMLLNAPLVTRFGPRNVLLGTLAVFSVAALFGQYVPSFAGVVMARIAQGLCAGLVQPLGLSVVFLAFPPEARGKAMGWYGMGIVFGPAIGPLIGGFIMEEAHWRMVLAAPLPVMFVAACLASRFVPGRDEDAVRTPFNAVSFVLVVGSVMLFLTGISAGQRDGWTTDQVFFLLFGSASAMIAFILRELSTPNPLLQLRLFTYPKYVAAAVVAFVFGAGVFGTLYIIPVLVQTVQGLSPLGSGLVLLPGGIVMLIAFPFAGQIAGKFPAYVTIGSGLLILVCSCWLLAGTGILTTFWTMAALIALGRVGLSMIHPALSLITLEAVPRELAAYASGTNYFIRMTGGAIGVNALAIYMDSRIAGHGHELLISQTADNFVSTDLRDRLFMFLETTGLPVGERLGLAEGYLRDVLSLKAHELAFQDGHIALALFFLAGAFTAVPLLLRRD